MSARPAIVPALCALSLLSACGLRDIRQQTEMAESLGTITGRVDVSSGRSGPVHAVLLKAGKTEMDYVVIADAVADPDGSFRLTALPGTYFIAAYQDLDRDGHFQRPTEPAAYPTTDGLKPKPYVLAEGKPLGIDPLVLKEPLEGPPQVSTTYDLLAITKNIGRVVSLDDPMFSADNGSTGLWRPVDFLKDVGGGLFMLQDYHAGLTPVIFVHGINGTPANFAPVIEALDKSRFQPWVLYYPSGLNLDVISDYLDRAVDALQARYGFKSVYVVGHSMGGLVARSFVMKHEERRHPGPVAFLMTINSPMLGMASAAKGVEFSPVVVPSWRDVAPGSDFIGALNAWKLPASIPYHLVFAYEPGEGNDGVVPIESQIPVSIQDESVRIYGFAGSHTGLLSDPEFLRHFQAALLAPPPDASPAAAGR